MNLQHRPASTTVPKTAWHEGALCVAQDADAPEPHVGHLWEASGLAGVWAEYSNSMYGGVLAAAQGMGMGLSG